MKKMNLFKKMNYSFLIPFEKANLEYSYEYFIYFPTPVGIPIKLTLRLGF